uniref:Uncharacterized protein n=1 Tax=Grammatophora oceanica TaxID=210454 RepID=A0A6U5PFZ2_9STRA
MTFSSSRPGRSSRDNNKNNSNGGGGAAQKGGTNKTTPPTALLKALLAAHNNNNNKGGPGLAKPLEILLECNSLAVLEQVALEEAQASSSKLRARRQARAKGEGASVMSALSTPSGSTNFSTFWVWEWALVIFKSDFMKKFHTHAHYANNQNKSSSRDQQQQNQQSPPTFQPLHAAAQVKDCPLAFLILSMRAYPQQVRTPADDIHGNLPLHTVAGWDVTDPSSVSRKSMALSTLVSEYPQASKVRNKQGKTPLSLALETGTSWDNGVRRLTSFQREGSFRSATGPSRQSSYVTHRSGTSAAR